MTDDNLRQRIQYLITYGGVFPEAAPARRPWVIALVVLEVTQTVLILVRYL